MTTSKAIVLNQLPDSLSLVNHRRRNKRPKTIATTYINAVDVWMDIFKGNPLFDNLKGYTNYEEVIHLNRDPERRQTKYNTRSVPSNFWRFHHEQSGHGCILLFESHLQLTNRIFLKCLYVEPEYSNMEIATVCLNELKEITIRVDELARNKTPHRGKTLNGQYCVLSLCPNSFSVEGWAYRDDKDMDWSHDYMPDNNMVDNRNGDMDQNLIRVSDGRLKAYYKKHGFIDAEYLDYHFIKVRKRL